MKPIPFFGKRYMFLWQKVYVFYLYMSGNNVLGGLPRGFDLLDGSEDFIHHLGDDGVSVGFD